MRKYRAGIYVRCSTSEQDTSMQESALTEYATRRGWLVNEIYSDEGMSGARVSRPGLDRLLGDCRRGKIDVVLVWKFDRFARSLSQLLDALSLFKALRIGFVSCTEEIDTALPSGELVFQIFGAMAQFERSLISERVKAGLAHARSRGKKLGRPAKRILGAEDIEQLRADRSSKKSSFRSLAEKYGISVFTAHRLCTHMPDKKTTHF